MEKEIKNIIIKNKALDKVIKNYSHNNTSLIIRIHGEGISQGITAQ